jgi:hypothetical protein
MLDCETRKGKVFMGEQYKTQSLIESMGFVLINTATPDHTADVVIAKKDGDLLKMIGIAEIRTREFAGDKRLTRRYLSENGGYLVTYTKLKFGGELAYQFGVPFFLIVRLISENVILIWKITDVNGQRLFEFKTKKSKTQETCNGGVATRVNAYLPLDKAKIFEF